MRSLYESILDIDNEKLDHASDDVILANAKRHNIEVSRKDGKYHIESLVITRRKDGQICNGSLRGSRINDDQALEEIFVGPLRDAEINHVQNFHGAWSQKDIPLSELTTVIPKPHRYIITDPDNISAIDMDIDIVDIQTMTDSPITWTPTIDKHAKMLMISDSYNEDRNIHAWGRFTDWANCKCKVVILTCTDVFGGQIKPYYQGFSMNEYFKGKYNDYGEPVLKEKLDNQNSELADHMKLWMTHNPKVNLIIHIGRNYEQIILKKDILSAKQVTIDQINQMIR